MPLKDIDLKTFDSYKKAIHQDVSKISDSSKVKFWVYKDVELPDAQGKKQKIAGLIVLGDDTGCRNALRGKKMICSGTCHLEQGKVAFDPLKGKVPYAKLKKSVPMFLGKPLHVPPGANENDEGDEGGESEQQEGTQPQSSVQQSSVTQPQVQQPTPPSPELINAWNELGKQVQTALATADNGRKEAINKAMVGIPELIKANNQAEATKRIEAVKTLLASKPSGQLDAKALSAEWGKLVPRIKASGDAELMKAAADAGKQLSDFVNHGKLKEAQELIDRITERLEHPKTTEQKPTETAKLEPKDIAAAWQKLVPEINKKTSAHPELKETAARARKQAEDLTKAGKLAEAKHYLEEFAKHVAGLTDHAPEKESESEEHSDTGTKKPETTGKTKEETEEPETESEESTDPRKAEYDRRWARMEKEVEETLRAQAGDVSRIRAAVALAGERAEDGDYASALKVLDGLQDLLDEEPDEDDAPPSGLVEYRKKLHAFQSARLKVEQQIEKLSAEIQKVLPDEEDFAETLADELEEELGEIQDLIDGADAAAKDEKSAADKAVRSRIQKTLETLESNPLVGEAESNPFGVGVDIRKPLGTALEAILESMPVIA